MPFLETMAIVVAGKLVMRLYESIPERPRQKIDRALGVGLNTAGKVGVRVAAETTKAAVTPVAGSIAGEAASMATKKVGDKVVDTLVNIDE